MGVNLSITCKNLRSDPQFAEMQILDLPAPAFQLIVEYMVLALELRKALRLRLICSESFQDPNRAYRHLIRRAETFDSEVKRALFMTGSFELPMSPSPDYMTREYIQMWLEAKVRMPRLRDKSLIREVISKTSLCLLSDTSVIQSGQELSAIIHDLCGAIAQEYSSLKFPDIAFEMSEPSLEAYQPEKDLLHYYRVMKRNSQTASSLALLLV